MKALVALDWGSSQLRAYRIDGEGRIVDQRGSGDGASRLGGGAPAFEAALRALAGDWLDGGPVLACGMVGSAHGWREAAYVPCPLALDALHRHLVAVHGADGLVVHIVPGATVRAAGGAPDVMRGEETQLAGLLQAEPALAAGARVVMPGTHSKWAELHDGRLQGFATRMTGELYALLREHSVLGRLMTSSEGFDPEAFDRGVAAARAAGGGDLARLLFGVRARGLFGELAPQAAPDFLSGLLIGAELCAAFTAPDARPLLLVGEPALCQRYARASAAWGVPARAIDRPLAALGLWAVARAADLA